MADTKDLIKYKETIEEALYTNFPEFNINVFSDLEEGFELPAIVVNKPIFEPADVTMTTMCSKLKMTMNSNVFVIYSAADRTNEIDCVQKAAEIAKFINMNRFGEKLPATISIIEPVLEEGLEDYFIQRIDFSQKIEI